MYQPPGTGLWPPAGLDVWNTIFGNSIFIGNGFLDTNDGHIGYEYYLGLSKKYFPEQNDFDRDKGTTNDCRNAAWILQENCQNWHDIEDPVVSIGAGPIVVELNVCLCQGMCAPRSDQTWVIPSPHVKEPVYFSVEVITACDKKGIHYETLLNVQNREIILSDIEETGLVMLDTEIDFTSWKLACNYNLILVGGPVANIIVKQLVSEGISTVDWLTSSGEWEYIRAPYDGCDILIVAGADRDATRAAVLEIIDYLQMKEQEEQIREVEEDT